MTSLSLERCFNHGARGASGRCPECRRYHCRECLTEHEGRVLCSACLARRRPPVSPSGGRASYAVAALLNLLLLLLLVYGVGALLLRLPSTFDESSEHSRQAP